MVAKPKVLVTGADGFIGSHLTEHLVRQGYDVRALAMYNSFNSFGWLDHVASDVRSAVDIVSGDVRDPHGIKTAVAGCEIVLHLAALIAVPYSYHAPSSYVETNVMGTLNVLEAARQTDVGRIVCTSTSEIYGTAQFVPITEDHPQNAQSPYAATKIGADHLALSYHRAFALPVTVLRPFNTYGPRQSARAIIPTIITQLLSGGRTLRLGSLHPTRDFSYVEDIARAFEAIARAPGVEGQVINVGGGFEVSMAEVAAIIASAVGVTATIECDEKRVRPAGSEVDRLCAATDKARKLLQWQPEFAGVEGFKRGIARTVAWFREPANLDRYKADRYNI